MLNSSSLGLVAKHIGLGRIAAIGLLVGVGGVFAGTGCGGALGGECLLDSDCNANLICAYQFCHIPCTETQDCDTAGGEECLFSHKTDKNPYNYCAIPISCKSDVECGDFRKCAEDQKCRDKCEDDGECLNDQLCFEGSCRKAKDVPAAGGDVPAGNDEPCGIHSDCASKNCGNGVCRGCIFDFDCGGTRTCDTNALGGEGMCMETSVPLQAKVTPIDAIGDVVDAVLDSEAKHIYITALTGNGQNTGVYRIGPDKKICPISALNGTYSRRIAISTDDSTLFLNFAPGYFSGISSIALPAPDMCEPRNPTPVQWTTTIANQNVYSLVVTPSPQGDMIYFTADGKLAVGSMDTGSEWMKLPTVSDIAIGGGRTFLLTNANLLAEILPDKSIALLSDARPIGIANVLFDWIPNIVTNRSGNVIYLVEYADGYDTVVAIDVAHSFVTSRYRMPIELGPYSPYGPQGKKIRRAQNSDTYVVVTSQGKLYLFEPQ